MHEVTVLDFLSIEARAFYVMDRDYLDFGRLYKMHQGGAFFVTRAKRNLSAADLLCRQGSERCHHLLPDDRDERLFFLARLSGASLRHIRFNDPDTGKTLIFLTNNTAPPALTIAPLYKQRRQV